MNTYNVVPGRRHALKLFTVNNTLILINVFVFIVLSIVIASRPDFIDYIGINPSNILHGKYFWTFLTSMFMHEPFPNITHILFNMISLFFVGTLLERIIGPRRYLMIYLVSGLFAGLVFVLLSGFFGTSFIGAKLFGSPDMYGIGASGAIFGVLGVLAVLTPRNKINLLAGPLIAIILDYFFTTVFPNAAFTNVLNIILTIYIFASIFTIFSFDPKIMKVSIPLTLPFWLLPVVAIVPLVIIGLFISLPIGNSAHLGGLIAGVAYGFFLRYRFPRKTKVISQIFSR